jgi:hypothetical protein
MAEDFPVSSDRQEWMNDASRWSFVGLLMENCLLMLSCGRKDIRMIEGGNGMFLFRQITQARSASRQSSSRQALQPSLWGMILSGVRLLLEVVLLCCQVVEYLAIL